MECDDMSTWLDAYIDGELDEARRERLATHARGCSRCATSIEDRRRLRSAVAGAAYRPAPSIVRERVLRQLAGAEDGAPASDQPRERGRNIRTPRWAWASLAACAALAGAILWMSMQAGTGGSNALLHEAVSSHIRSLMALHLTDVATSDRHTVKPWFAGKLDFAPRVVDLAPDGFPLAGGRLDYIAGRPVAALVYNRGAHVINLFTCPDAKGRPETPREIVDRGYSVVTWSDGAARFCAVSDASPSELRAFAAYFQERSADAPPSSRNP